MKFNEKSKENKKIKMGEENNQFIFFYLNKELKYIEILNFEIRLRTMSKLHFLKIN